MINRNLPYYPKNMTMREHLAFKILESWESNSEPSKKLSDIEACFYVADKFINYANQQREAQNEPPKKLRHMLQDGETWTAETLPDMNKKVIYITSTPGQCFGPSYAKHLLFKNIKGWEYIND